MTIPSPEGPPDEDTQPPVRPGASNTEEAAPFEIFTSDPEWLAAREVYKRRDGANATERRWNGREAADRLYEIEVALEAAWHEGGGDR